VDNTAILGQLEALAQDLGVQIRYEYLEEETSFPGGGLCRLGDQHLIIVNARATIGEKVQTLARAMKRFDLGQVYLKPAVRDLLDGVVGKR